MNSFKPLNLYPKEASSILSSSVITKLSKASNVWILLTRKCLYPGILHTGLLKRVKCNICGNPISDCMWLQLLILLLWRYKNFNYVKPSKTLIGGRETIELSLKSIFFKFLKLYKYIKSLSYKKFPCK